uniref:Arsenic resistance protein ArsH n=1 Tax=Klebsiella pneumoniae TaxID=573 RepID=A0A8B0SYG6_KLEPN|nr:Arsenic resistance protein ArsH [Klebsiella pneumoniae]
MQVCGGSQSFNAVNQMRILGRWMRMITIPNQSSVAKARQEFDEDGRMKTIPVLRPYCGCNGRADEVYPADPGSMQRISSIATVNVKSRQKHFPGG